MVECLCLTLMNWLHTWLITRMLKKSWNWFFTNLQLKIGQCKLATSLLYTYGKMFGVLSLKKEVSLIIGRRWFFLFFDSCCYDYWCKLCVILLFLPRELMVHRVCTGLEDLRWVLPSTFLGYSLSYIFISYSCSWDPIHRCATVCIKKRHSTRMFFKGNFFFVGKRVRGFCTSSSYQVHLVLFFPCRERTVSPASVSMDLQAAPGWMGPEVLKAYREMMVPWAHQVKAEISQ